jgi:DNA-binding response OmpR family regulator
MPAQVRLASHHRAGDYPQPLPPEPAGACLQRTGPVLLVVEDEPLILMMTQDALEASGYRVIAVGNGADAELALAGRSIAGLITDIRLGSGPNGWELAERARELEPTLPVVYATADKAAHWPVHGVTDSIMLQKPFSAAEIVSSVRAVLEGQTERG